MKVYSIFDEFLTLSGTSPPQTHGEVSETLKGLFVGRIATIFIVWNVQNQRPLLLFVTSWHSLLSTSHSLFHIVACSASWFHEGRTANIKVDHSLDQHIPTHYFAQFSNCPVLTVTLRLTLPSSNARFMMRHVDPKERQGRISSTFMHLGSQRNATCSEKTVGKSMHISTMICTG